jgi:hypothetical protein
LLRRFHEGICAVTAGTIQSRLRVPDAGTRFILTRQIMQEPVLLAVIQATARMVPQSVQTNRQGKQ